MSDPHHPARPEPGRATSRPAPRAAAAAPVPDPLLTVRRALALPELAAGEPEVVAGVSGLDREVRWAHVVAGADAAELLDGGELVLTTGAGWPQDADSLRGLADSLAAADPAAVVLELGSNFAAAPAQLAAACERAGIPLVLLHRATRFVQVTQRIHQGILTAQTEALRARAEVHTMLTELGLNRSPVDYVVERLAETLDAAVVLEDPAHRVVAWSGRGQDPAAILRPWALADGQAPVLDPASLDSDSPDPAAPGGTAERVPVEARGSRWGYLTALPGRPHPAGRRTVLELGAFALALARLADSDGEQWLRFASKRLFDTVLGGRYRSDVELAAQLAAGGLPIDGRIVFGATLRGTGDFGAHASLERAILETALRRAVAPEGRVLLADSDDGSDDGRPALLALVSLPPGDPRADSGVGPGTGRGEPAAESARGAGAPGGPTAAASPLAARLARELEMLVPGTTPPGWRAHLALGAPGRRLRQLVASLEQVRAAGRLPGAAHFGRVTVQQAERQPLAYLVRGLAGLPEVQEFAGDALGPIVAYDREFRGDLVRVLGAYLAHPTNRSLAAQKALLSRSVFYQRLALIEDLLGVDLADGETIATLTVALLARPA